PGHFDELKARDRTIDDFRGKVAEQAWWRYDRAIDYVSDFDVPVAMLLLPMLPSRGPDEALAEVAEARGFPVLNYNRLDLYPDLFEREHWFDYYHVGRSGVDLLTTLIGQDICPLLEKGRN
ncbi:MAG: hypothetical protein ACR2P3_03935, partial [Geminicoccaceae bacterium]